MKRISLILCLILGNLLLLSALQESINYPRTGERCPDFLLTDVQQFHKTAVTLDDFKGKWLILDFWSEYCASCISAFPKMNNIQQTFSGDVQILFIGIPYKDPNTIKKLYDVHRQELDLKIPIVFDEKLAVQFGVGTYPHIVVVDPEGIVRYITGGSLSEENVQDIIEGKKVTLRHKYNKFEAKPYSYYNKDIPFLVSGNGGHEQDYLYRSVLARATEGTPPLRFFPKQDRLEILGFPLANLYQYAYIGQISNTLHNLQDRSLYGAYWPIAVIEVHDSTLFSPNTSTKENLFSYSAHLPNKFSDVVGRNTLHFREILKKDLAALFPFTAHLERRMMPCYHLRIDEDKIEQLKSKYEEREIGQTTGRGFLGKKVSLSQIITKLTHSTDYDDTIPMVFEGEDIEIDLEYESIYFEDIVQELKNKGIEITNGTREIYVLVIRDK